jgi:hypothetical protein
MMNLTVKNTTMISTHVLDKGGRGFATRLTGCEAEVPDDAKRIRQKEESG